MDTLSSGRRFRILTLVDDFTRECLGLIVDTSLTALRVVRELDQIIESRGCPRMIVSDNGTEFTSNAILTWQEELGIEWHYIAPRSIGWRQLVRTPLDVEAPDPDIIMRRLATSERIMTPVPTPQGSLTITRN